MGVTPLAVPAGGGAGQPRDLRGRFASTLTAPSSGVCLMDELSDEDYNAEGTYRYPPNPRSWQQNAKFWLACPISDEELDEFVDYYREHYRHDPDVNAHAEPIMREWYKQHPGFKVDPGQGLADWDRQASREWDRARDSYPHRKCFISPQRARAVVRAAQMYQWSRYLGQEAINHTLDVAVPVKPGEDWTVRRVMTEYKIRQVTINIDDRYAAEHIRIWKNNARIDREQEGHGAREPFKLGKKFSSWEFDKIFHIYAARHRYGH